MASQKRGGVTKVRAKYHFLTYTQRLRIEMRINAGYTQTQIADELGVSSSTISRELRRGRYEHMKTDLTTEWRYSPEIAETRYREGLAAKGAQLKIGKRHDVAQFIERLILGDHYSPAAACAKLREADLGITFCRQTIYKLTNGTWCTTTCCVFTTAIASNTKS